MIPFSKVGTNLEKTKKVLNFGNETQRSSLLMRSSPSFTLPDPPQVNGSKSQHKHSRVTVTRQPPHCVLPSHFVPLLFVPCKTNITQHSECVNLLQFTLFLQLGLKIVGVGMELGNVGRGVRVVHCVGSGWGGSRMGQGGGTTGSCTWSPPSSHVTLNEGMMRISEILIRLLTLSGF